VLSVLSSRGLGRRGADTNRSKRICRGADTSGWEEEDKEEDGDGGLLRVLVVTLKLQVMLMTMDDDDVS
jgi:hypothetical protein